MPEEVITNLSQVTAEWLTRVLSEKGALSSGRVTLIELDSNERILSTSTRIRIAYSDDSSGDKPTRLILKTVNVDQDEDFFGRSEVNYYLRDYIDLPSAPIPRCYSGVYSETERRYHLLLDDLSASHVEAKYKPRTLDYGLALAEGLACLHAHW